MHAKHVLLVAVSAFGVGLIILIGVAAWSASSVEIDNFSPPSIDDVEQELEHYYAHYENGDGRPRGELVGCPTREAGLWFYCEFDYPTIAATKQITCVHVYVDEPCCSWEEDRWVISDVTRARAKQESESGPTACG